MNTDKIEQAMAVLKENGYAIENLWQVHDVLDRYETTDSQAMLIINEALRHEKVIDTILEVIEMYAEQSGFKSLP